MIDNVVFDCDGVLTDGSYYYNEHGKAMKKFSALDSVGVRKLKELGIRCIMVSSDPDITINRIRAVALGVEYYFAPFGHKLDLVSSLISLKNTVYIGDCIDDVPLLIKAGKSFTPQSAIEEVSKYADQVLSSNGGNGCILEIYVKGYYK